MLSFRWQPPLGLSFGLFVLQDKILLSSYPLALSKGEYKALSTLGILFVEK